MILHDIKLDNFGVYGPEQQFRFTPTDSGRFNRPITLLRGKNGVGKSTLMEAIRLALHGSLVLGGRASQAEYEAYLRRRIYRPMNGTQPQSASVGLTFDLFANGRKQQYHVLREWDASRKSAVATTLTITENGKQLNEQDGDAFLRDLIDPGLLDLFFFDGEKIRTLAAEGERSDLLLGDTIKLLLGLHLVEQLDRDLGVFMTRKDEMSELSELTQQLGTIESEIAMHGNQLIMFQQDLESKTAERKRKRQALRKAERKLHRAGSLYADQRRTLELQQQEAETSIAATEAQLHEMAKGVLPFAFVPELLIETREQLLKEEQHERWRMTHETLGSVREALVMDGVDAGKVDKHFAPYATSPMGDNELIHGASAESRRQMLGWIDEALNETPRQLVQTVNRLKQHTAALDDVKLKLAQVPDEQQLKPLRETVETLKRDFWEAESAETQLTQQIDQLTEQRKRIIAEQHAINDQIARSEADSTPLKLAARTRQLLQNYEARLTAAKLKQVEERLSARFVQLCRKRHFVDRVAIDPHSFAVTLYRGDDAFPRGQLSAGEQQLFAIATLWALREVSNRPMPILIDTPLSRLDSEHRQAMLTEFFPHAAHQTIILATDAEIDDRLVEEIRPALSHFYQLSLDEGLGATAAEYEDPTLNQPILIGLEEIAIS